MRVDEYRTFCRMYEQMWKRKTFETTVDVEEFGRLQEDLPETHRMRILICEQDGVPVAGLVASAMGDSAIYLLGATSDDGLNAKGAYLLQWTLIQWLKENGIKWYDLGGIDPEGNPGVYTFKKGLSGTDVSQLTPLVACDERCLFCGRQGKPGCTACGAELGHSAPWPRDQINGLRQWAQYSKKTAARAPYLNTRSKRSRFVVETGTKNARR